MIRPMPGICSYCSADNITGELTRHADANAAAMMSLRMDCCPLVILGVRMPAPPTLKIDRLVTARSESHHSTTEGAASFNRGHGPTLPLPIRLDRLGAFHLYRGQQQRPTILALTARRYSALRWSRSKHGRSATPAQNSSPKSYCCDAHSTSATGQSLLMRTPPASHRSEIVRWSQRMDATLYLKGKDGVLEMDQEISSRVYCGREDGVVGSLEARRVAEGNWTSVW